MRGVTHRLWELRRRGEFRLNALPTADWTFDHVGIVVADFAGALALYTGTFGFAIRYRETLAAHGIEAVGLALGAQTIELLRPLAPDSPVARFCGKAESRLHHVAYRVPDVAAELARLEALGVRLIDRVPRPGAHGNLVAFLHPSATLGVLTELCAPAGKPRS
ncbi:MAG: methylmalonyl-CoA epimerase [Vulcanimicrobiaceae bacterium]